MGQKSIKKNYLFNLSYQILLLITPLITTPYVSRVLGARGIGTVSYTESIATYFVLAATMGITTYGQREISYVQDSIEKRSTVFWNTKILQFVTSFLTFSVYAVFAFYRKESLIYLIFSLNIVAVFFDVTWFFQGMEEFGKIVFRNIVFKIFNILYIFAFVKNAEDVYLYALGLCLFTVLSNISLWFYLPKYIKKIDYSNLHPFKRLSVVISLFVPTIAISIYTVLDKTMIGVITNNSFENGYYEQSLKISRMVLTIVTALGTVMIPRIGFHFEKGDTEEVKRLMYRGYRFVWFLGIPLCFGLIMVAPNFVPWFFGTGYGKVVDLLRIHAFLILAIGINNVTGMQYLIPTNRQNAFTFTVIIGAATNFVLNAILIDILMSKGAAIASVVAETIIAVVQLIIVRKELSPLIVIKEGIHYYIAGFGMIIGLKFSGKLFTPSVLHTMILICIGGSIYIGMLLLMRDEFLLSNIKTVLDKFRR